MTKEDFCVKLINDLDSLTDFIHENSSLFFDVPVPDNYPYYPPRDAQSVSIGSVAILLLCAKQQLDLLHEFLLFPDRRLI